jgi:hypothetical protein
MDIIDRHTQTGHLSSAFPRIRRIIGALGRNGAWPHIKIGYTSDLNRRAYYYDRRGWQQMYILYTTSSIDYARAMECRAILFIKEETSTLGWIWNIAAGRNGRVAKDAQQFYTYAVVARKYSRLAH